MLLHPSMMLLRSKFPLVSAWEANQPGADAPIRCWKGEDAMVARPYHDVKVTRLPDGGRSECAEDGDLRPSWVAAER
jgi:hypothetical protein